MKTQNLALPWRREGRNGLLNTVLTTVYARLTLREGSQAEGKEGGGLVQSFAGPDKVPFPNLHRCHLARGSPSVGCLP